MKIIFVSLCVFPTLILHLLFRVIMATYFYLTTETLKRELFTLLDGNLKESIFRQQKEKLQKVNKTFRHALWNLEFFLLSWNWVTLASILPWYWFSSVVFHEQCIQIFGKRCANRLKVKENEHLITKKFDSLSWLHQAIYAHPLANGDYLGIFLRGWLTQWNRKNVDWTQYGFDST